VWSGGRNPVSFLNGAIKELTGQIQDNYKDPTQVKILSKAIEQATALKNAFPGDKGRQLEWWHDTLSRFGFRLDAEIDRGLEKQMFDALGIEAVPEGPVRSELTAAGEQTLIPGTEGRIVPRTALPGARA